LTAFRRYISITKNEGYVSIPVTCATGSYTGFLFLF
jgi:hypothetical protein